MKVQTLFCSACDRDVRVVLTAAPLEQGHATLPDPEFICLEIGDQCTGALCPLFALPPEAMKAKLARSGLDASNLRTFRAGCMECDRVTDLLVLNRSYVYCSECGTTMHWRVTHPESLPT